MAVVKFSKQRLDDALNKDVEDYRHKVLGAVEEYSASLQAAYMAQKNMETTAEFRSPAERAAYGLLRESGVLNSFKDTTPQEMTEAQKNAAQTDLDKLKVWVEGHEGRIDKKLTPITNRKLRAECNAALNLIPQKMRMEVLWDAKDLASNTTKISAIAMPKNDNDVSSESQKMACNLIQRLGGFSLLTEYDKVVGEKMVKVGGVEESVPTTEKKIKSKKVVLNNSRMSDLVGILGEKYNEVCMKNNRY